MIPASTSTLRQTWRAAHAGGAQHAELADPLPAVHRERVRDPEPGDHDGREGQQVEQPEHAVQRVADAPGDARDRGGGQGQLRREVVRPRGRRRPRRAGLVADDPGVGALDGEAADGVRPADQQRPRRRRPGTNARRGRRPRARPARRRSPTTMNPRPPRPSGGPRDGQDHRPARVDRRQRGRPVAAGERQPAVRREVGAADRDGVEAGAVEGEVERRDRRRPRHAVDRRDLAVRSRRCRSAPARWP